jgi:hypothetical protein
MPRNQPVALRAIGPLTWIDLLVAGGRLVRYWETRRLQISEVLGESLATRTVAMMNSYNSVYYGILIAAALTGWAELAHSALPWALAGVMIATALDLCIRRYLWARRICRETRQYFSRQYGRSIKCRSATPNIPAIRRLLRINKVPRPNGPHCLGTARHRR